MCQFQADLAGSGNYKSCIKVYQIMLNTALVTLLEFNHCIVHGKKIGFSICSLP